MFPDATGAIFDVAGAPVTLAITLDGGLLANAAVDGRMMIVNDGDNASDMRVKILALAFANGRTGSNSGGCLFSRESLTISGASTTTCVSDGNAKGAGYGGALERG